MRRLALLLLPAALLLPACDLDDQSCDCVDGEDEQDDEDQDDEDQDDEDQDDEDQDDEDQDDEDQDESVDDAVFSSIDVGVMTYYSGFEALEEGDRLDLELGGQGLLMFSVDLSATTDIPYLEGTTFGDEFGGTGPLVTAELDVPDYNWGGGGHFASVSTRLLYVMEMGTFVGEGIDLIIPDGLDPAEIDLRDATLTVRVEQENGDDLEWTQVVELEDNGY